MEIDVLIDDAAWDAAGLEALANTAHPAALTALGLRPDRFAVSILACDDARIATLNAEFRGKPLPTNVLSWPTEDRYVAAGQIPDLPVAQPDGPPLELGDIAIAHGVCAREATDLNRPFDDHVTHLLVHGLLHLLGFDHIDDADAALMEGIETRILATLGVPDPY